MTAFCSTQTTYAADSCAPHFFRCFRATSAQLLAVGRGGIFTGLPWALSSALTAPGDDKTEPLSVGLKVSVTAELTTLMLSLMIVSSFEILSLR